MEAGSSQSKWNNNSAPLKDWGPMPVSKSKTCNSQLAELEERFHKNPLDSPTAKVVPSPADDHEDSQAAVTATDGEEVPVIAIAPTRVWLGDLPQGVSLPPDCVYIGRNMGKHIRSVGWGNPFCCGRHPTAAKRRQAVASFRKYLSSNEELLLRLEELGGKRLACHCPSGVVCHGDVLIEAWIKRFGHHNTLLPACTDSLTRNGRVSPSSFMWSHGGDVSSMGLGLQCWLRSSTSALGQFVQQQTEEDTSQRTVSPFLPLPREIEAEEFCCKIRRTCRPATTFHQSA